MRATIRTADRAGAALKAIAALLAGASSLLPAAAFAMQVPVAPLSAAGARTTPGTPLQAIPPAAMPPESRARLNPTGRDIALTGPLRSGTDILDDVDFVLGGDDSLSINAILLVKALRTAIDSAALDDLKMKIADVGFVSAERLRLLGYGVSYDAEAIGVDITIPTEARPTRALKLYQYATPATREFDAPASLSGYVNFRSFLTYEWSGASRGFDVPAAFIDSAIRYKGVVLENQAVFDANSTQPFRRSSSRLVYDDRFRLLRWSAGDLQPLSRGFANAPQIAGVGVNRIYSQLDPLLLVQPSGNRTFTLGRPSTVKAVINGQPIKQFRLQPGTYNLSDFPFAQGGNNVQLQIQDDSGITQTVAFSIFFDRTLLAPGRTEFGLYAGILAPQTATGRDYQTDEPAASGFFRRGITDTFTAGANFDLQTRGGLGGIEAIWANTLGTFGLNAAVSQVKDFGTGYAVNASFTIVGRQWGTAAGVAVEHRSTNFTGPSAFAGFNRFSWDLSATLSQRLFTTQSVSITARYALGRDAFANETSLRAQYNWQINNRLYLTGEALYQDGSFARHDLSARIRISVRIDSRSSAYTQYNSFDNRGQIGVETTRGAGVGALALAADTSFGSDSVGANGSLTYLANRADIGLQHTTLFDLNGQNIDSQRTIMRLGTGIAFADGHFAVTRPIFDSFVMARAHRTLNGATVYIDPSLNSHEAKSDFFGPAVQPNLSAYIPRVVTYDVPDAPAGYDIGVGALRILPPYRSGYLVTAGSDYSITVVGILLGTDGKPVALLAGGAVELARPERPTMTIFTNQAGRFGLSGLRPGRWRIDMPTQPPSSVVIDVPPGANGLVRVGSLRLGERK